MNWDLVIWATGVVAVAVGGIFGGRRIGRSAGEINRDVDPNTQLVDMLASANRRIDRLEADNSHGKVRLSDVERDLSLERDHSKRQDQSIASLQAENHEQRQQLSILRRALEGWEAWHRLLIAKWDEYRVQPDPPDAPQIADVD